MKQQDFFIGWQERLTDSNKKPIRRFLMVGLIMILLIALLFVLNQKEFSNHVFQLGKITQVEGYYYDDPVPMFLVEDSTWNNNISREILLVGYGKSGAEGIMEAIQREKGNLRNSNIKLQGTLIYGDGKAIMELTRKKESVLEVMENKLVSQPVNIKQAVSLQGEIIDPKCYFGVMKPGEGKIHKSCAIRCISGGIPPVFKTKTNTDVSYYILTGLQVEKINKEVLPFVGELSQVKGSAHVSNGWNVLAIDPSTIKLLH